jgi:hypothetical protein
MIILLFEIINFDQYKYDMPLEIVTKYNQIYIITIKKKTIPCTSVTIKAVINNYYFLISMQKLILKKIHINKENDQYIFN